MFLSFDLLFEDSLQFTKRARTKFCQLSPLLTKRLMDITLSLELLNLSRFSFNFIKKETLAQVFSSEFCEISKDIFSYRIPLVAASGIKNAKTIYVYIGSHRK